MKRLIFTLVGISLLEEEKGLLGKDRRTLTSNLGEIKKQGNIEAFITDNDSSKVKDLKNEVLNALAKMSLRDEYDDFSAEITSLYFLKPDNAVDNEDDKIILIVTQTPECAFAGIVNGKYIICRRTNKRDWDSIIFNKSNDVFSCDNVEIKVIDGLQVENGTEFASVGIKNLFTFVSNKIENEGVSYDEIIFNITGGYKGTIPYLTLFGMLYQEKEIKGKKIKSFSQYLFEQSKEIITLPNLPVAFDIFTWRNYRGFVRAMPHLEVKVAKMFLDNILPAQIGGLFEEDKLENKYRLTTLGETLEKKYNEEKEGELTPYGRGYLLVDKIHDKHKRKALQDCINRWQYLWLGDLIPETVEHARGHTQRVLELAAQILYPILNKDEKFFGDVNQTDNNLIALISAIWLHDLGHSGDYIKWKNDNIEKPLEYEIKGFPSLIRELHHFLSCDLIDKGKNTLFESRDKNDEWVRDPTIFSKELIESIRLICLYHRGGMPVLHNKEKRDYVGLGVKESLEELRRDHVNIPLLAALLRIADGGDVQEERTISPNYRAMRDLQTDRELKTLKKEERKYREKVDVSQLPDYLCYLKETASKYFGGVSLKRDEQYEEITNISKDTEMMEKLEELKKENPDHCNDALLDYLTIKCIQKYIQDEGLNDIDDTKIVLRNWLSALDQYVFKRSTGPHFNKHRGISAVMYLPDKPKEENSKNKNEYHYKVLAIHKEGKDDGERIELIKNVKKVLKEEIKKEYEKVKDILNDHHIYFDTYGMMEEGNDEMDLV
jgi:CRISPR/Cas system-associated protein Csm6